MGKKISNIEICRWYIKKYHSNLYTRNLAFNINTKRGRTKLNNIKAYYPYEIFDRLLTWCEQKEGWEYWIKESLKITYLCYYINQDEKTVNYLYNLLARGKTLDDNFIKSIQSLLKQ